MASDMVYGACSLTLLIHIVKTELLSYAERGFIAVYSAQLLMLGPFRTMLTSVRSDVGNNSSIESVDVVFKLKKSTVLKDYFISVEDSHFAYLTS